MKKNLVCLVIALFVGTMMLAACSSDKGPAEVAVKAAEEAINGVKTEVGKLVPDQVKSLEDTLAAVKEKFGKGEYKAALAEAQTLTGKAKEVIEAAKAKKEELNKTWTELSGQLPKMVEAVQSRVDILSKSKKLPANLTTEKFEEVKTGLAAAKEEWTKALDGFKEGNIGEAVATATSVKEKAVMAMEALGLPVPGAPEAPAPAPAK